MLGSSGLDGTMNILGGSKAEEFMKEIGNRAGSLNQVVENMDVACFRALDSMAAGTEQIGRSISEEVVGSASVEQVEVSKILDNPIFITDKLQFTFGGMSSIRELPRNSSSSKAMGDGMDLDRIKLRINFGKIWNLPGVNVKEVSSKSEHANTVSCGFFKVSERTSSVRGNASIEINGSQEPCLPSRGPG